ncbi:hypothetical protein BDP55DRAFT_724266 [Colletotrichum godetiae]|uniref:Uncharacterized protein n=1 Tax=Colletotrichum godetiae TaxID=1209918 RepID=A0AAJ0AYV6_9PEZI|nr:uncharacterized protein BDP55DRAFT_724266 [Colletotrichum godetiae]KAK1690649.1 hypothetical protein BDP55DRAFT_724266 [Colletotrichum godetiae]
MSKLRKCTRATVLSILLASAHTASIPSVFERQNTCAAEGFTSCGNGLPGNFCCGTGKKCITLAGNTTVLCCPEGESCDRISPITCNINLQDPVAHPDASIKTTVLKGTLATCGDSCCPFGYSCNSLSQCTMDSDQTKAPEEASTPVPKPSSTATAAPSVIPTTIAASATPAETNNNNNDSDTDNKNGTFPTAIVIGSLCGLLVGVGLGVAALLFCARRRRRGPPPLNEKKRSGGGGGGPRPSTSTSSFGNFISEPIPITDNATVRTDFILKTPSTTHSRSRSGSGSVTSPAGYTPNKGHNRLSSTATTLAHHPIGLARSDSAPRTPPGRVGGGGGGVAGAGAVPPIRGMRPNSGSRRLQPPNVPNPLAPPKPGYIINNNSNQSHLQREPSSESISVFADPRTVGGRPGVKRNTTFTDMMEEAELGDVRRGKPYVPYTPQMPSQVVR